MRLFSWKGLLVLLLLGCVVLAFGGYRLQLYLDHPLAIEGEGMEYTLNRGDTLGAMAYHLGVQGVLSHPRWLTVYSRLTGRGHNIHAGDYWLEAGLTPRQLLDKLEQGDVRYFEVTLVEGWTVMQVLGHLRRQERLRQTLPPGPLTADVLDLDWERPLEGMFFPDTYRYHSGDSDRSVLVQAFERMRTVLKREWEQRAEGLPYKDAYEALIMASLVEKETGYAPERPQIAGVFVRRLQKSMRLQTDPAVIYGLGADFDGNLRRRDLKNGDNPYNTYRHSGLTPTPIALAGREAIHAALHPAEGSALYFVARGDGSHYFSDTLEEHQQAVRKYQIEQRNRNYQSAPPPNG